MSKRAEQKKRRELCEIAQRLADNSANDGLRVVCIVTDASGEFVGVGMNTAGDDADRILRCALVGEGLEYYDAVNGAEYSRRGRTTSTVALRSNAGAVDAKRTSDTSGDKQGVDRG